MPPTIPTYAQQFGVAAPGQTRGILSTFINPCEHLLAAMLIANFLIELRKAAVASVDHGSFDTFGTLEFTEIIGELRSTILGPGETLVRDSDCAEDEGSSVQCSMCHDEAELRTWRTQGTKAGLDTPM
ncbi:hypothetical protein OH77DRAFT_1521745 [Trametes cingulata]|nr:hypothetical protein OH77DRAFT_1521745 [Trametes cingulata]